LDDGRDLKRGETVALPVVVVLLLLIFRGIVAPMLPLVVALVAIAGALDPAGRRPGFRPVQLLGQRGDHGRAGAGGRLLACCWRAAREERAAGLAPPQAIERKLASAGRTVAFSGLTVAVSLAGLLVFAEPLLRSLAWSGIGVVLAALAARPRQSAEAAGDLSGRSCASWTTCGCPSRTTRPIGIFAWSSFSRRSLATGTLAGAQAFLRLRSYLSTARKHQMNPLARAPPALPSQPLATTSGRSLEAHGTVPPPIGRRAARQSL
jgi:MMPL family